MFKRWIAGVALVPLLFTSTPTNADSAPSSSPLPTVTSYVTVTSVQIGDSGDLVRQVQYVLRSYGYSITVDGVFGPQTLDRVLHWQRANGLAVDGIVGPQTLRSLGLTGQPSAGPPAPTVSPQPSAPSQSLRCPQYASALQDAGLPLSFFDPVMYRESGCNPRAYNGRGNDDSYGLFQINTKGVLWGELQWRCGLTSKDQLFDAVTNIQCAAKLYAAYGKRPWAL